MSSIVITGTSRGLGLEFVKQYLQKGENVVATARNLSKARELATLKEKFKDQLTLVEVDVDSAESVKSAFKNLKNLKIKTLINNAGVFTDDRSTGFLELEEKKIMDSFATNVVGPIRVTQNLLHAFSSNELGKVVIISSLMGSIADNQSGGCYGYRMSKTAVNMFTKSFSIEFKNKNILCVSLHPGWVQTDMGGTQAPLTADFAVSNMIETIAKLQMKDSGHFFNFDGKELPW